MTIPPPTWITDLIARHHWLFRNIEDCGFDVPDGWRGIVEPLCRALDDLDMDDLAVVQGKEKYGGLRIYIEGSPEDPKFDHARALVSAVEDQSLFVCWTCGAPATSQAGTTLCPECNDEERRHR